MQSNALLALVCLLQAQVPSYNDEVHRLSAANEWAGLQALAESHLKSHPLDADAWNILGTAHARQDNLDDALKAFEQASKAAPEKPDSWFNQGMIWALRMDAEKVRNCAEGLRKASRVHLIRFLNQDAVLAALVGAPLPPPLPQGHRPKMRTSPGLEGLGDLMRGQGEAWFVVCVSAGGVPQETHLLFGDAGMKRAMLLQARRTAFEPVLVNGKAAPFRIIQSLGSSSTITTRDSFLTSRRR